MADDKRAAPGEKPRRRHAPQIDLTATEIKPESREPAAEQAAQPEEISEPAQAIGPPPASTSPQPVARAVTYAAVAAALIAAIISGGGLLWIVNKPAATNPELNTRLAALETQLRALEQRPAPQADNRPLAALTQRIAKLEEAASKPASAPAPDTALNGRIAALESNLASVTRNTQALQSSLLQRPGTDAIEALTKRLDALEQNAKSTQNKIAKNTGADAAARQMLAAMLLRDAALRGAPFAAELSAVKQHSPDAQAVAALEPFAASGIPSETALSRELSDLLPSMIAAAKADSAHSGFLERLEANAEKLVRIRPAGESAGNDPAATLARIEAKLVRNDVAGAEKEIAALPEKARQLTEPWRKKFAARVTAIEASRKLVAAGAATLAR